jgi:hypothetical protein
VQRRGPGDARAVLEGGCEVQEPRTWKEPRKGKVSGVYDSLHDDLDSNVKHNCTNKNVQFSDCVQIKIIDKFVPRKTAVADRVVFSINFTDHVNVFHDNQLLLDTCAGESVFRTDTLFYDIVDAPVPMVVNGVDSKGQPMVITQSGTTDFGIVYYYPDCIANILSFANMVNNCYSVSYSSKNDFYSVQIKRGGCNYYFHRDTKYNIYMRFK